MDTANLLTPWVVLAAVLVPIILLERWIQSHLYGVGWLLTNNKKTATALYYILWFPGVFVHEFTQYLLAGALNVRIKRMIAWPEAQDDGTLRLDFVQIQKANRVQAAIIGAAPLLVGTGLIYLISNHILNLDALLNAILAWDSARLQTALSDLTNTPDFYLWLYLILALSNTMLPTPTDREGWPLLIGVFAAIIALMLVLGADQGVLLETYEDTVVGGLELMTTAFGAVLVVELPAVFLIGFFEEVLERTTGRKFDYARSPTQQRQRRRPAKREPGSSLPLRPGETPPSIYNLELPLPDPADASRLLAQRKRALAPAPAPRDRVPGPAAERREATPAATVSRSPSLQQREERRAAPPGARQNIPASQERDRLKPRPGTRTPSLPGDRVQPGSKTPDRDRAPRPGAERPGIERRPGSSPGQQPGFASRSRPAGPERDDQPRSPTDARRSRQEFPGQRPAAGSHSRPVSSTASTDRERDRSRLPDDAGPVRAPRPQVGRPSPADSLRSRPERASPFRSPFTPDDADDHPLTDDDVGVDDVEYVDFDDL